MKFKPHELDAAVIEKMQFMDNVTFSTLLSTFGDGGGGTFTEALEQSVERLIDQGRLRAEGKAIPRYRLAGFRPCATSNAQVSIPSIAAPRHYTNVTPGLGTLSLTEFMAPEREGAEDFKKYKSLRT